MELIFKQRRKQKTIIEDFFEIVQNRTFYQFLRLMKKLINFQWSIKTTLIEFYYSNKKQADMFQNGRKY
jgi:hypothetical protein